MDRAAANATGVGRARLGPAARLLCALLVACSGGPAAQQPAATPRAAAAGIEATPWREADALFRRDARWLGGDAAISIALDAERVLWLFGDSFIAEPGARSRRGARMVRNSVGLQHGLDPSRADMRFYFGRAEGGGAASFIPEPEAAWYWPAHGVYLDGVLTLFVTRVQADPGSALGFRTSGWGAFRVQGAQAEPDRWRLEPLVTPDTEAIGIVGASVLVEDGFVYAYAVREPGDHAALLLRWSRDAFERGELMHPEWFGDAQRGFGAGPPATVFDGGATEFSVARAGLGGYVQVQSRGFGAAPIALRTAASATGPFGPLTDVYLPDEASRPQVLLYAARGHAELRGAELIVTYASNSLDPAALLDDLDLYFPRFVRLQWRR